jgi:predicted nucleic acid-binding protein
MTATEFLDTNVLVYAYDLNDRRKQHIAQELLQRAVSSEIATSSQVLAEFAATLLHKMKPIVQPAALIDILNAFGPIPLIPLDDHIVVRAVQAHAQYGLHFYDGMIVAAAERGGCQKIWSEDLNPGQKYFNVPVENPFI